MPERSRSLHPFSGTPRRPSGDGGVLGGVQWGVLHVWERATDSVTSEGAIHAESLRRDLPAVARSLQDVLGQRLTAVVAGVADAKAVGKWIKGSRVPHPDAERRLR